MNTTLTLLQLDETKVLETVSHSLGHLTRIHMMFRRMLKLIIYKNFSERPETGMKVSGSWSIESLHGLILLGAQRYWVLVL